MKLRVLTLALIVGFVSLQAEARRNGAPSGRTGGPGSNGQSCTLCHSDNAGAGAVEILGAPDEYEADVLYDLIVRVSDRQQSGGGFEISAETAQGSLAGELILVSGLFTQFAEGSPSFVTHTSAGVQDSITNWNARGKTVEYQLQWRAPSQDVGEITFWAAGNAINDDFTSEGDFVYLSQKSASFKGGGGIDCNEVKSLKVKCKRGKIKATMKSNLAGGTNVTFSLDGGQETKAATTKNNGKAKAKFKNAAPGSHEVCLEECPDICKQVDCV